VNHGRLFAQIVAAVFPGERIDRIGAQLAAPGGLSDRDVNRLADLDLVHAHGRMHDEGRHAGVLANGSLVFGGHVDV
jgi:hypothetical protein